MFLSVSIFSDNIDVERSGKADFGTTACPIMYFDWSHLLTPSSYNLLSLE